MCDGVSVYCNPVVLYLCWIQKNEVLVHHILKSY